MEISPLSVPEILFLLGVTESHYDYIFSCKYVMFPCVFMLDFIFSQSLRVTKCCPILKLRSHRGNIVSQHLCNKVMKSYYQTVKKDEVVFAPSVVVMSEVNLYQEAYIKACSILRVIPEKVVGRASHRDIRLRGEASEIAKFWIEDDNECKNSINIYHLKYCH